LTHRFDLLIEKMRLIVLLNLLFLELHEMIKEHLVLRGKVPHLLVKNAIRLLQGLVLFLDNVIVIIQFIHGGLQILKTLLAVMLLLNMLNQFSVLERYRLIKYLALLSGVVQVDSEFLSQLHLLCELAQELGALSLCLKLRVVQPIQVSEGSGLTFPRRIGSL
jgi:hypothetical protein